MSKFWPNQAPGVAKGVWSKRAGTSRNKTNQERQSRNKTNQEQNKLGTMPTRHSAIQERRQLGTMSSRNKDIQERNHLGTIFNEKIKLGTIFGYRLSPTFFIRNQKLYIFYALKNRSQLSETSRNDFQGLSYLSPIHTSLGKVRFQQVRVFFRFSYKKHIPS